MNKTVFHAADVEPRGLMRNSHELNTPVPCTVAGDEMMGFFPDTPAGRYASIMKLVIHGRAIRHIF